MQLALRRASWMTSAQTQVNPGRAQRRSPEGRKQPFEASGSAWRQLTHGVGQIHVHASLEIPLLQSNVYPEYSDLVVKPDG